MFTFCEGHPHQTKGILENCISRTQQEASYSHPCTLKHYRSAQHARSGKTLLIPFIFLCFKRHSKWASVSLINSCHFFVSQHTYRMKTKLLMRPVRSRKSVLCYRPLTQYMTITIVFFLGLYTKPPSHLWAWYLLVLLPRMPYSGSFQGLFSLFRIQDPA